MYGFKQGNCQAVLINSQKTHVFKVPLTKRYDQNAIPYSWRPRRIYRRYLRMQRYRQNVLRFETVITILKKLEKITDHRLEIFFPSTEIFRVNGMEHIVGESRLRYSGPLIKQEFVENFFGNNVCLDSFDWEDIPRVQIELWKFGVGIGAPADTWGPKNWGLTKSGSVRLVDTSHISEDFDCIMNLVGDDTMWSRRMQLFSQNNVSPPRLIERYFEFIRQHINRDNLVKHWRSNL